MNKKESKGLIIAAIILLIGAFASSISTIIIMNVNNINMYLLLLLNASALVFALVYLLSGYRKQDAKKFKGFLFSYSISILLAILASAEIGEKYQVMGTLGIVVFALNFGCVMTLGIAKDLGKMTSISLALECVFTVTFVSLIGLAILPGMFRNGDSFATVYMLGLSRHFALAFTLYICVKAKYIDKDSRGTN